MEQATLSLLKPAILAIAGLAAVCGIYYTCTAVLTHPPDTGLQRSNAVRRRPAPSVLAPGDLRWRMVPPGLNTAIGVLEFECGNREYVYDMADGSLPSRETLSNQLGPLDDLAYRQVCIRVIKFIVAVTLEAQHFPNVRAEVAMTPFADLLRIEGDLEQNIRALEIAAAHVMNMTPPRPEEFSNMYEIAMADDGPAVTEEPVEDTDAPHEHTHGLKGLLYYIAEQDANRQGYEHRGISCEECGQLPIRGVRWRCLNCADFDLCTTCEAHTAHPKTHLFAKIKVPLPPMSNNGKTLPLWYSGDARKIYPPLQPASRKRLFEQYKFDEPSIDALYDQFTCLANVHFLQDPLGIMVAIDQAGFRRAMIPEWWNLRSAPNAIMDRTFHFYDTNADGLIAFEEFVNGTSFLRSPARFDTMRRVLQGFDIDDNGYLDRSDFLRLLRAKYVLQEKQVNDMVEMGENDQTLDALQTLRSSQPISAIFNQQDIPHGEDRPRQGKQLDAFGDMQPLPGIKTILEEDDPWLLDNAIPTPGSAGGLRHHASPSPEMLKGQDDRDDISSNTDAANIRDFANEDSSMVSDHGPYRDVLLQIVEQGMNEILDRIFRLKEQEHDAAIATRQERNEWRTEIEDYLAEKQRIAEELCLMASTDPLAATAMHSHTRQPPPTPAGSPEPPFRADILPTDTESLAEREADIAHQPLDRLLEQAGYEIIDGRGNGALMPQDDEDNESRLPESLRHLLRPPSILNDTSADPTMPQNRPNTASVVEDGALTHENAPRANKAGLPLSSGESKSRPTVLSAARLSLLASMEEIDREVVTRGGCGRLSFDEVETIVKADRTNELLGLVKSWLEFASF
ncbi:hypothetical protein BAUCODRAFT_562798 [Baudoinia panamericana UAMH 10762]|uniref:Uncharacterized protein n=1 Tax=Baudoinia panamericana (strain UAMH 10762) TaxID=717646 RepID=M2MTE5_BAUPA|nr:uncharacterized protein BAUCODRAFT_562798 [Baudoinia panamericana UAMH 10762]EMC94808.1 hypothetical protein BAUCODRAFT_562798 [Baudoinia panamericana UAMH 10762]